MLSPENLISKHRIQFIGHLGTFPSNFSVDSPLLGNGDLACTIDGKADKLLLWVNKNDFWKLKAGHEYGGSPKHFGKVSIGCPQLKGGKFSLVQDLWTATTSANFKRKSLHLIISTFVAACNNWIIITLQSLAKKTHINVSLDYVVSKSPDSSGSVNVGNMYTILRRTFSENVDIPTAAGMGVKILGNNGSHFTLSPGETVKIACYMVSNFDTPDPEAAVIQAMKEISLKTIDQLYTEHLAWWKDYWQRCYVNLPDKKVEKIYYLSNYILGSCCRNPDFPPPIFGPWITTDTPGWMGDYHMNYNHMAPYYGLYSSNHIEQADVYHQPIFDFMERGKYYAKKVHDSRGVLYPVGIGPKGIETTRLCPDKKHHKGAYLDEGMFWGQKSNAAYAVVNLSMRWYSTYDVEYAQSIYPFVKEVAKFWEDNLEFEGNRYVIRDDAVHEGSYGDFNPILTLGLVTNVFTTILDMAENLDRDRNLYEKWNHILSHLSDFPRQTRKKKPVFRYTEKGMAWNNGNTLGIQHIYPANAINWKNSPEMLEVSRNMIAAMHRWVDGNGMNSFYMAAIRVGYDPKIIWRNLQKIVRKNFRTNGFLKNNPHGIENCSIIPNAVNEMLCSGVEGIIRLFPSWQPHKDAEFVQIRVYGAFLVSGKIKDGVIGEVEIFSEQGRLCRVKNPWGVASVEVRSDSGRKDLLSGIIIEFGSKKGEKVMLTPCETG